jgi:hypothetical protein
VIEDYRVKSNVSFVNTDKLYLSVAPVITGDNVALGSILINGEDKSSMMKNGRILVEYDNKKDVVVQVGVKSISSTYLVSGSLSKNGNPASSVLVRFTGSTGYVREILADVSYSVYLPKDTYKVEMVCATGNSSTYTLTVSKKTTFDISVIGKIVGGSATINGKTYGSSSGYYVDNEGTFASCKDVQALGTVMFTGVASDCAVIEFTVECFLNPTTLPAGAKYEKDATVSVFVSNGNIESSVGYHATSARVRTDHKGSWSTHTKQPVSNILPKSLSENGTIQKFLCVYLDNTWHMYFEKDGKLELAYVYKFNEGESATGKCVFGLYVATSYVYTRIRFNNVSIETDRAYVQETLANLQNK